MANKAKRDEFYTELSDIENELRHYKDCLKGKTVFCNCDDPFESNFFRYFAINFNFLGLRKLICTCYAGSPVSYSELNDLPLFHQDQKLPYKIEITEVPDLNGDGAVDLSDIELLLRSNKNNLTILDGDGDFRSEECIEFLKESDVVVTNPPFSLFREYIAQLIEYNKKFIIIGNINCITYKEIFPLIKNNMLWAGFNDKAGTRKGNTMMFAIPDNNYSTKSVIELDGKRMQQVSAWWFTNIDIEKRHEELILYRHYTPEEYPKYDNYDAINVNKTCDIPEDYKEIIGVPITFLDKYNPNQFEIIGLAPERGGFKLQNRRYENAIQHNRDGSTQGGNKVNDGPVLAYDEKPNKYPYYTASNSNKYLQVLYARILIKRRIHEN